VDGELCRVVVDPHADPSLIVHHVVDAVGNGLAQLLVEKVVNADFLRLAAWEREDDSLVYRDADTLRLAKRLRKHRDGLFAFLDKPEVPFDNNLAERAIRPAVILRKNSQSNRSEQGAVPQAVLMSIYQMLKLRGLDPTNTITVALRTYPLTGELPPLPGQHLANG